MKAEQKAAACYDPMGTSVEAADAEQTYLNLRKQLAETDEPHEFKLIADDITLEKLGVEMAKQGGSLAILTAEGGFLGTIGGRYADGMANLDLVLKSYSGEPVKVDRVGRDSIEITHPLLTLVLIVQPDVVHELTANRTFVQRGLAARFLYALPVSTVGYRSVHEADLNVYLMNKWKGCIREIFDSPSRILYPSAEARERFDAFRAAHERRLAPYTGDLDQIVEWGSKLPGQVARIAGIYTLIANPQAKVVDDDAMRDAIGVADYLAAHAMAALVATPQNKAASELGDWIRDEKLRRFTVRDAQRALHRRTWCTDADAVRAAARVLERYGWVRHVPPSAKVTEPRPIKVTERSGRPAETYRVNPDILIHDVGLPPGSTTTCHRV